MKWFLTFLTGIAAGVAATYLVDQKGTEKRYKELKKDFVSLEKKWSKRLDSLKKTYNEVVEKYASVGKEAIESTKAKVHLN